MLFRVDVGSSFFLIFNANTAQSSEAKVGGTIERHELINKSTRDTRRKNLQHEIQDESKPSLTFD